MRRHPDRRLNRRGNVGKGPERAPTAPSCVSNPSKWPRSAPLTTNTSISKSVVLTGLRVRVPPSVPRHLARFRDLRNGEKSPETSAPTICRQLAALWAPVPTVSRHLLPADDAQLRQSGSAGPTARQKPDHRDAGEHDDYHQDHHREEVATVHRHVRVAHQVPQSAAVVRRAASPDRSQQRQRKPR